MKKITKTLGHKSKRGKSLGEGGASPLLNFIFEAGMLKRATRSGWSVLGIKHAESVADHSFRCAVLGYVLAKMEKADSAKVLLMTLFGDMQEARTTDLHKMAVRYVNIKKIDDKAFAEQICKLPREIKEELAQARREYKSQKSRQAVIARDADILECLIQAREYHEQGYAQAVKFTKKAPSCLKTKSARSLWRQAKKADISKWWLRLSDFQR